MAKFLKTKEYIEIPNPTKKELFAIFKMNILQCNLVFREPTGKNDGDIIYTIVLDERSYKGKTNIIKVSYNFSPLHFVNYDDLIKNVTEMSQKGILSIQIPIDIFKEKEPLIILLEDFNQTIVENCVFADYYDSKFLIENRPGPKGERDALYYFELNDSVLAFTTKGPKLIYGRFSSVEEIFCVK
jgi:hypothetical protein